VEQAVVDWRTRGYGLMAVTDRASGRFLGRCGLQSVTGHAEPELGWVLRADAWGRGYGSEAARACLAWALADLRLTSVISLIHPRNHAAVRVAERVGMVHDGAAELRGVPVDVYRANSVTAASQ
jgi:RimJ/RimL family protein N-acetyltransferase